MSEISDEFQNDGTAMMCDLETGICGPAETEAVGPLQPVSFGPTKKVDLYYVTDPVCSHCWALEPTLRRLTEEYGHHLEVKTVMGGMLPRWEGFADRANGIKGPADVAGHWREVGEASRMPIDGSVWLRDPLTSSFPPSRVFVTLRERDPELATRFLRLAREAVFAFDRNISDPTVLADLVDELGPDGRALVAEAESEHGERLLRRDISLARELGVRGFPTLVFVDAEGNGVKVVGVRSQEQYVEALTAVLGAEPRPRTLPTLRDLLERDGRLFAKEIEELYGVEPGALEGFVEERLRPDAYSRGDVLGEAYFQLRATAAPAS